MGHLFLTGFMATGKSTVGRALARRLGHPFIDLDAEIERRAGMSVAEIFRLHGEEDFRARERAALEEVCRGARAVVATGGGVVLDARNRTAMRGAGEIVCLAASRDEILARIGPGGERPLLASASDRARRIDELLVERGPAYADADLTVDTSGRSPVEVVEAIVERLEPAAARSPAREPARRGRQS
jgi:shikimate kinase